MVGNSDDDCETDINVYFCLVSYFERVFWSCSSLTCDETSSLCSGFVMKIIIYNSMVGLYLIFIFLFLLYQMISFIHKHIDFVVKSS